MPTPRLLGVSKRWCCFGSHTLPSRTVALNGGVGDADDPADFEATLCNLGSRLPLRAAAFRARRATVLRDRGLLPESSRTRGARWATVLRHRGLLPSPIAPHRVLESAILLSRRALLARAGNSSCRPWSSSNSSINNLRQYLDREGAQHLQDG